MLSRAMKPLLVGVVLLAGCQETVVTPVREIAPLALSVAGADCLTNPDPTSCLESVGAANLVSSAAPAPPVGSIKIAIIQPFPSGATGVVNAANALYGLGTVTAVSISDVIGGVLISGGYHVAVMNRGAGPILPAGFEPALDAAVSAGVGLLTEWNGGSPFWTTNGSAFQYNQVFSGTPGTLFGWFGGAVDHGDCCSWIPFPLPITNTDPSHPLMAGFPASFTISSLEFCYRIQGADPSLQVVGTVQPFSGPVAPVIMGGTRGSGRIAFFLCDWGDNGGGDALAKLWVNNAIVWAAAGANQPPVANAGPDQTVECANDCATVTLDGSGSTDPNGTIASYEWSEGASVIATGSNPSVTLGLGSHAITLKVTDNAGASASDQVIIDVVDTQAPTIALSLSPTSLFPPNHRMVLVATGVGASDACDASPSVSVSVSSNEPINGLGDGDTSPDWEVVSTGNGKYDVYVRAERSGKGSSRVYTISVTAMDASGNSSSTSGTVTVPHDKR